MSYSIKGRIEFKNKKIPVLKPDNVSLGKCVTCHHFVRKYSSINDVEIINMLRDGCVFKGFKRVRAESVEEEGFANMHFILLLSNKDDTVHKQLCIRRISRLRLHFHTMEEVSEVLTSSSSAVVFFVDHTYRKVFLFHFKKTTIKKIEIPLDYDQNWKFELISDILYIEKDSLFFINFCGSVPFLRKIKIGINQEAVAYSNEMVVLVQMDDESEQQSLVCDMLQMQNIQKQMIPSEEVMETLFDSMLIIVNAKNRFVWVACSGYSILVLTSKMLDDINPLFDIKLSDLFPHCNNFHFKTSCYCNCTSQVFIVYTKSFNNEVSSAVIVLDLNSLTVSSILELELTLNRRPQIDMHASVSGHKLFVQETFDNKVIFYQVFKLIPNDLTLQNITKQFIWENLSEEVENSEMLPRHLKQDLKEGF